MPAFMALLRGVNVGTGKRVPMADFRTLLSGLGYAQVVTLLNSGNAVFHAARGAPATHATRIAGAIAARLQIEVRVVVKSAAQLAAIVAENPLSAGCTDHSRLLVVFAQDAGALRSLAPVEALVRPPERFVLSGNAAYLACPDGILGSKAGAALLGKTGQRVTTRNWATVLKLHALANGPGG